MTTTKSKPRCEKRVFSGFHSYQYFQCPNTAKMTHEGKHYCGAHDPVKRQARDNAKAKEWDDRNNRNEAKRSEAEGYAKLLGGGSPHYDRGWGAQLGSYTGGVVLTAEECRKLIARLELADRYGDLQK